MDDRMNLGKDESTFEIFALNKFATRSQLGRTLIITIDEIESCLVSSPSGGQFDNKLILNLKLDRKLATSNIRVGSRFLIESICSGVYLHIHTSSLVCVD